MDMEFSVKSTLVFIALLGLTFAMPAVRIKPHPELRSGYVEGDMILNTSTRNGLRDPVYKWPNNTVYYKFLAQFDEPHKNHILRAMQMIESVSCIRFKEATDDIKSFVEITDIEYVCFSHVGYLNKGAQKLNISPDPLDEGCFMLGTIIHELLHTLGFYHMHSASNRDEYIRFAVENLDPGSLEYQFKKYDNDTVDNYDQEYDYGSIMHYPADALSINGNLTIIPLKDENAVNIMGQRRGMSKSDINRLNVMYRCPVNH